MKYVTAVLLTFVFLLSMTGCNKTSPSEPPLPSGEAVTPTPTPTPTPMPTPSPTPEPSTLPMPEGFPENAGDAEYMAPVTDDYVLLGAADVNRPDYSADMEITLFSFDESGAVIQAVSKWIFADEAAAAAIEAAAGTIEHLKQPFVRVENVIYVMGTDEGHYQNLSNKEKALEFIEYFTMSYMSKP